MKPKAYKHDRKPEFCIRPGCGNRKSAKGLCHLDYQAARRLVIKGVTTWEELYKARKALPPNQRSKFFIL